MGIQNVLIINDDTDDIAKIQARLPKRVSVAATSQLGARAAAMPEGLDLVIIDNDANMQNPAKGPETLARIRQQNPEVPVLFTSYQPGWVEGSVYQTSGVQVVRTDLLLEKLAEMGIKLKQGADEKPIQEPLLNLIMTYNFVEGYRPGIYSEGKLLIVSYGKDAKEKGREVAREQLDRIYKNFDFRADRDKIANVFIYDGINGKDEPGNAALSIGHAAHMPVYLMVCNCEWDRKARLERSSNVKLVEVECGGEKSLGKIADIILGVQRPGVDYSQVGRGRYTLAADQIRQPIEKHRI